MLTKIQEDPVRKQAREAQWSKDGVPELFNWITQLIENTKGDTTGLNTLLHCLPMLQSSYRSNWNESFNAAYELLKEEQDKINAFITFMDNYKNSLSSLSMI